MKFHIIWKTISIYDLKSIEDNHEWVALPRSLLLWQPGNQLVQVTVQEEDQHFTQSYPAIQLAT